MHIYDAKLLESELEKEIEEVDKKIEKAWNNLQLAFRIVMIISTCMFLTGIFMEMGV